MPMRLLFAIIVGCALVPSGALANDWIDEPGLQARLRGGEVVLRVDVEEHGRSARARAAIWLASPAQAVWSVLTDCAHAAEFVPGLKRCRCIEGGRSRWEGCTLLERDFKYSWLMPAVHDVVHVDYAWPRRIDIQRVSGDLKEERGTWRLEPDPDSAGTILEYEFEVTPGFWMPSRLLQHSLIDNLRQGMASVRTRLQDRPLEGSHLTTR